MAPAALTLPPRTLIHLKPPPPLLMFHVSYSKSHESLSGSVYCKSCEVNWRAARHGMWCLGALGVACMSSLRKRAAAGGAQDGQLCELRSWNLAVCHKHDCGVHNGVCHGCILLRACSPASLQSGGAMAAVRCLMLGQAGLRAPATPILCQTR